MNWLLFLEKLNKIPLYILLFLTPIFFLPFTQNVLDFPKQILALFLILLSLIGWLGRKIFEGKLALRGNKIFYFSLSLIFLSLLFSSIFSLLPNTSFLNQSSDVADNFLTFLLLLILVLLFTNSFDKETESLPFLFFFILSSAIAGVINIFQIYKIFPLPFDFAKISSFNTVGTANSLAILGAVLLPLSLILTFRAKGSFKIILGLISFALFLNVLLVNFQTAWIGLIAGILVLFIFSFGNQKKIKAGWVALLMIGLIFSLFFYLFPVLLPGFPVLTPEVSLNSSSEIYILKGVFSGGIKNIILGTGPGTFIFDYSQYHSSLLNQTIFWGTRFSNGNSMFLDWILTKGILGGISLLFFYVLIIYFSVKHLRKIDDPEDYSGIKLGLVAGIISLIVVSFLYPFNFVLHFTFWVFIGGFLLYFIPKLPAVNLSSPYKIIFTNSILVIIIIFSLSLFFIQGQKYFAEVQYLRGIEASQAGNLDKAINYINGATKLNPSLDIYWRDLSQLYLAKTNSISQDSGLSIEDKRRFTMLTVVSGADAINRAKDLAPMNVADWNVRGFFYRNLIGIIPGSEEIALSSYQRAIQLEPASPFAFGERGRVYILIAQDLSQKKENELSQQNLNLAIENLNKAIELKSDYAPAHYLLAVVYDQQGKIEQAISKLEETELISPQDPGVAFQLGLLYCRSQKLDNAKSEFERAVDLNSFYSNAKYMLGLVYDKEGEKEKAQEQFEELVKSNPQNQQVEKILGNLKNGLPALAGITKEPICSQLPIEESPPEIQK